ncbi:phenylalanyl-tRNA synthetase subunit beta [Thermogladius calderae 1633]|uniref:phenylalanine--tRNA ligase n=1 Tax=Thermogladius calderae (strain DSM 22663 / VKM B-2946 / 1633) TaxID=1184251 RepID=I3TGB4_THEC1|nr:phenylalanyl-tRNA synthetase subunit beta [Thermogladius calderae 1633]
MRVDDLYRLLGVELDVKSLVRLMTKLKCEIEDLAGGNLVYEANHDRPDLFSAEGLSRALKFMLGLPVRRPPVSGCGVVAYAEPVPDRPFVAFAIVRNVELDDEALKQIIQLQEKLHTTYGRNRKRASIGLYDLDMVKPPVYYRAVDPDETRYRPLGYDKEMSLREVLSQTDKGREYGHIISKMEKYPVIMDSEGRILSLAPILNSEDAKVTTSTRNVLIDSTGLDPRVVVDMVTIMAYSLAERGRDTEICLMETQFSDGKRLAAPRVEGVVQELTIGQVNDLLGTEISVKEAANFLGMFGYDVVEAAGDKLVVRAPPYRIDVLGWVDVAEDIAIGYGYERLGEEATGLPPSRSSGREDEVEHLSDLLRRVLVSMGFSEVANYMMTSAEVDVRLYNRRVEPIVVANPISERFTSLRTWLTAGLVNFIVENKNKSAEFRIFEVGDVVYVREGRVYEERRVGVAISSPEATLTDGLAVVNTLLNAIGLSPAFREGEIDGLLRERTAEIIVRDDNVGFVGEVHPEVLLKLEYDRPIVTIEIDVGKILKVLRAQ